LLHDELELAGMLRRGLLEWSKKIIWHVAGMPEDG
jgi:hypothetical protein